jgi:hypothetical protein
MPDQSRGRRRVKRLVSGLLGWVCVLKSQIRAYW